MKKSCSNCEKEEYCEHNEFKIRYPLCWSKRKHGKMK